MINFDPDGYWLRFNDQKVTDTYIPVTSRINLTVLDDKLSERFHIRLKAQLGSGDITIDIQSYETYGYQIFMVHGKDLVYGVAFLTCTEVEK